MPASAAIRTLTEAGDLRTWSLIVTIFGDMARTPGAELPGPVLSEITARIGVKPEAMRVALHRLRKDGWIASRRVGRVSHYRLTASGLAESERATARIFARRTPPPERWHVAVAGPLDPGARLALEGAMAEHMPIAAGVWLGQGPAPTTLPPGLFTIDGSALGLPDWLRDGLMPPELARCYAAFDARVARVATHLAGGDATLALLDRTAIRILLVHGWRRLVLRHAALPDAVFPRGWAGPRVRDRVHGLLDRLGQPTIRELADTASV